jgi:general secretion pathway protein G
LLEVLVVIVILGVLYAFLIRPIVGAGDKNKVKISEMGMMRLKSNIEIFRTKYNQLPNNLSALVQCNEQTGPGCVPEMSREELKDAFGNEFQYSTEGDGRAYKIRSLGADGREGGDGVNYDTTLTGP